MVKSNMKNSKKSPIIAKNKIFQENQIKPLKEEESGDFH